jgi:hypothetical protein
MDKSQGDGERTLFCLRRWNFWLFGCIQQGEEYNNTSHHIIYNHSPEGSITNAMARHYNSSTVLFLEFKPTTEIPIVPRFLTPNQRHFEGDMEQKLDPVPHSVRLRGPTGVSSLQCLISLKHRVGNLPTEETLSATCRSITLATVLREVCASCYHSAQSF